MALVGSSSVIVAQIPLSKDPLSKDQDLSHALLKSGIISSAIPLDPGTEYIKVCWHPLSTHHLVLLTDDNTLRILNVETFESGAEQTFALEHLLEDSAEASLVSLEVVNFCFGDASCASWQAFTIFLLNRDSDVFVLCPVVPYQCRVSANYFSAVSKYVNSQLADVLQTIESERVKDARRNARRRSPSSTASLKALTRQRLYLDSQVQWIVAVCGITSPSQRSILDSSLEIYTHNPNFPRSAHNSPSSKRHKQPASTWYFDISLQGPLDTQLSATESPQSAAISSAEVSAHDLCAISAVPLVLGRTHQSGHVELLVAVDQIIQPSWSVPDATFQPNLPSLLLWAGIDLSTQSGSIDSTQTIDKRALDGYPSSLSLLPTPPSFLPGLPQDNASTVVYLYSSCGIVKVDLPWVSQIDALLSGRSRTRDLPATHMQLLWNSASIDQPLLSIVGIASYVKPFAPITQHNDAIFVLAQCGSSRNLDICFVPRPSSTLHQSSLKQSILQSGGALLSSPAKSIETEEDRKYGALGSKFDEFWSASIPTLRAPARLAPNTFLGSSASDAMKNNHNLQLYRQISKQFEECEKQLESVEDNIKTRVEFLAKRMENDCSLYDSHCARLRQAASEEMRIVQTLQSQRATHVNFNKRLEVVKTMFRFAHDHALPSDTTWISELEKIATHLKEQETSISSMEGDITTIASELKMVALQVRGIPDLDSQRAVGYLQKLDEQSKSMETLTATLKRLQTQVGQLESAISSSSNQ